MSKFQFLKVKCLHVKDWYDGPMSGICEYNNEKLYYHWTKSLEWVYESKPTFKYVHCTRFFDIYRLPQSDIDLILSDLALYENHKNNYAEYEKLKPSYPKYLEDGDLLEKTAYENDWLIGYTSEDYWE